MVQITNEKGVALVTALMFTMMSLVICMALLYMIISGTQSSAALKRYRTTLDAAYGGTEIVVKDIVNAAFGFRDYSSSHPGTTFTSYLTDSMGTLKDSAYVSNCFRERLTLPRSQWSAGCASPDLNPTNNPDISFRLNATSGSPYVVYSKVVDTMERKFLVLEDSTAKTVVMAGNSDTSTIVLEGGSTSEAGGVTIPHYPYVYRLEVQGEKQEHAQEKANVSVMYAY